MGSREGGLAATKYQYLLGKVSTEVGSVVGEGNSVRINIY